MTKAKRCPHCGGEHTRLVRAGEGIYLVLEIFAFSISMWLPIIGWLMMPVLVIAMLVTLVRILMGKAQYHFYCDDCQQVFNRMDKKQYQNYKSQGF